MVDLVLDPLFSLLGLSSAQLLTGFSLDFGVLGNQHGGGDAWVGDSGACLFPSSHVDADWPGDLGLLEGGKGYEVNQKVADCVGAEIGHAGDLELNQELTGLPRIDVTERNYKYGVLVVICFDPFVDFLKRADPLD